MSPLKKPFDCGGDPDWDSVSYKNLARPAALAEFRSLLLLVMNYRSLTLDIKPNIQDSRLSLFYLPVLQIYNAVSSQWRFLTFIFKSRYLI